MIPDSLTQFQFDTIYNVFSLVIASQLFTSIFLVISLPRVLPRYRQALTVAAVVTGIAAYHYFRIFNSFTEAFVTEAVGGRGDYVQVAGASFNEGYRYVDWLLTVPLLLLELVAVLALANKVQASLLARLIPAAAAMIALGYVGEVAADNLTRGIWGFLSSIPFAYILYVLFVELTKSLKRQPESVRRTISLLRLLLLATWGVYPIAYLLPGLGIDGSDAWVGLQIGYSVADILAKCLYGLVIYRIARMKSFADDAQFALLEGSAEDSTTVKRSTVDQ